MTWSVEALSENIISIIVAIVSIVLISLLKPLIPKICSMVEAKISSMNNKTAMELSNNAMNILNNLVTTTVEYLEQEYGSSIRKSIAAGEKNSSELYALKDKAIEIIQNQMTDEMKTLISQQISNVEEYISDLISEKVRETKKSDAALSK